MSEIHFVDTTLRDGQMSLWATRMRTGMMLPIVERMDEAGFDAIELMSSIFLKKCTRDLKEDPFERLRLVAKKTPNTPLRMTSGRFNAFEVTPYSLYQLYLERMRANGMSQARISDEWNEFEGWKQKVKTVREAGLEPIINLIYSVSPKHTDEYYAERARQAASLDLPLICLKDPGGLITPDRVRTLVPLVLENVNGTPVEFHTHCTTGLGAAVLRGGHQARHHHRQHGDPAAGQRFVQPVAVQRRGQRPGTGPYHRGGRRVAACGLRALHPHRRAGGPAPRAAGGVRLRAIPAPGARRNVFQPAPPTGKRLGWGTSSTRPWRSAAGCGKSSPIRSW